MQLSFGSPLTLTCGETEGVFQGIFRWTHSLLAELSEGNELYVPYVTVENSGEYTCSVNVCSIAASDSITVAVTGNFRVYTSRAGYSVMAPLYMCQPSGNI